MFPLGFEPEGRFFIDERLESGCCVSLLCRRDAGWDH